jgi:hypothetical protein
MILALDPRLAPAAWQVEVLEWPIGIRKSTLLSALSELSEHIGGLVVSAAPK